MSDSRDLLKATCTTTVRAWQGEWPPLLSPHRPPPSRDRGGAYAGEDLHQHHATTIIDRETESSMRNGVKPDRPLTMQPASHNLTRPGCEARGRKQRSAGALTSRSHVPRSRCH